MARAFFQTAAIAATLLSAAPAVASPNVFWTFGFDPQYGHGAGGRADAGISSQQANLVPMLQATPSELAATDRRMWDEPAIPMRYARLDGATINLMPGGVPGR